MLSAKMPKYDEKTERVKFGEWTSKGLPLTDNIPLNFTFHKISNHIFLDPIREEEEASESRLTLTISKDKELFINSLQKENEYAFTKKELFEILDRAFKQFKESEKLVDKLEKLKGK